MQAPISLWTRACEEEPKKGWIALDSSPRFDPLPAFGRFLPERKCEDARENRANRDGLASSANAPPAPAAEAPSSAETAATECAAAAEVASTDGTAAAEIPAADGRSPAAQVAPCN